MKADYLTLTDGRKVRIEFNMNSVGEFTAITGKELVEFQTMKADVKVLRTIAWCSAVEGELCDGRELGMDEIQFARLMNMNAIVEFSKILTAQSAISSQKKSEPPSRSPLSYFRRRD